MEITLLEAIGTKPTDTFTLTLEPEPWKYFCFSDKNLKNTENLKKGSVWRVDGKEYDFCEQVNYYALRRVDYDIG